MTKSLAIRGVAPPDVSYGPFRFLEAVPWLMFASAMRFVAYGGGPLSVPAMLLASLAVFLAFMIAARRLIEWAEGRTDLGRLEFSAQLALGGRILLRVGGLLVAAVLIAAFFGPPDLAPYLIYGFDGIAFDQATAFGKILSSILAALVFLMVVAAGSGETATLTGALRELTGRAAWLVPAIVAVALMQFVLGSLQGVGRGWVYVFWNSSTAPESVKNLVYFAFVFGFAAVRLWVTIAILTLGLRASYRRGAA